MLLPIAEELFRDADLFSWECVGRRGRWGADSERKREGEVVACEEVRVIIVRENKHALLVIHASPD